jgi:dimeric dUTPase (all-alpha-NTP-PPase superfamily)
MSELIISLISLIVTAAGVSVFSLYLKRKEALLHHIKELLNHLRSMSSWDNRSELKLFQWMYESDEGTLHYRSLLELRNILNSLYSYWAVHQSMEANLPPEEIIRDFNKQPQKWSLWFIIKELFFPDKPRLLI